MKMTAEINNVLMQQTGPVSTRKLAELSGVKISRVAQYLHTLYINKQIKRAATKAVRGRAFLYVRPDLNLPGFDLIKRRRTYACRMRKAAGVTRPKSPAMMTLPTIAIPVGSKVVNMTIPEARQLYKELGGMFSGGLARTSK